jgi:hypothetical protein
VLGGLNGDDTGAVLEFLEDAHQNQVPILKRTGEVQTEVDNERVVVPVLDYSVHVDPIFLHLDLVNELVCAEHEGHDRHQGGSDGCRSLHDVVLSIIGNHRDGVVEEGRGGLDRLEGGF